MAEQVLIQFRADKALKQEVTEIYKRLGVDLPADRQLIFWKCRLMKLMLKFWK